MSRLFASVSVSVFLFFGGLMLTVSNAHAIGVHNSNITPESAYLEYADLFPSVGWIFGEENGAFTGFGSGVLIDENWVLTAGHVVLTNDGNPTSFYDSFLVGFGTNTSTDPGEFMSADEVFLNPLYSGVEQGVDLALLYFEDGFTSVDPAVLYGQAVQVGDVASIAGFGQPGTPATGAQAPDGTRRAGENIVEFTNSPANGYIEYFFSDPGDPDFLALGSQTSNGDSGGGWFIQSNNDFLLAGITSGGSQVIRYGSLSSAFDISLQTDWIDETIASRTEVPEPATILLLGAGLPFFRRLRRRAA